ncbi:bifunctional diaminohydroxyphosphoribosylaminopyrimidine deaminase/5-amino-6-(5-phosphoribosylamino)uracil reductase RibD [Roseateles sp. BYS180W]|uniref:Riboflavin biosynthesis protein RibD n=1 Tax=Roseateles rivi TaxID=3299028 RepID=A0ABW7FXY5_9BURK
MPTSESFDPLPASADWAHLHSALSLAEQAIGLSDPNPRVGCVITSAGGQVLGQGHTQQVGQAHAEVMALRDAAQQGNTVVGATAYVTLEPCAFFGRTPPCCDALIAAGLSRVVVALADPHPKVAGAGLARMRAAGIEVRVLDPQHPLAVAAAALNVGFLTRMARGTPWVRMKVACSIDAQTALRNGQSQWITGPEARRDGHAWRRRAQAVLTGIGTVLADNPRLSVRELPTHCQPLRVVLDSHARTPLQAQILAEPGATLVCGLGEPAAAATLRSAGAQWLALPAQGERVDLQALLQALGQREVNELHVEAGAVLNGALLQQGLVDELLLYVAPTLLGPGRPQAVLPELTALTQATRWRWLAPQLLGSDLRLRALR